MRERGWGAEDLQRPPCEEKFRRVWVCFFFLSFLFSSLFFCIYLFLVLPDIPGGWLAKVEAYFGVFELVMSHVQRSTEFKPDSS